MTTEATASSKPETLTEWARRRGPCPEVLKVLRDVGWSQRRAGQALRMTQAGIWDRCKRDGIQWKDSSRTRVWLGDRWGSVADAARLSGVGYATIYYRATVLGWTGEKLLQPVGQQSRTGPKHYDVGLTMDEWRVVLDELEEEAEKAGSRVRARYRIASRRRLQYGAISSADRGEWERLA